MRLLIICLFLLVSGCSQQKEASSNASVGSKTACDTPTSAVKRVKPYKAPTKRVERLWVEPVYKTKTDCWGNEFTFLQQEGYWIEIEIHTGYEWTR